MGKITVKFTDTTAGVSRLHRVEGNPNFTVVVARIIRRVLGEQAARNREDGPVRQGGYGQPALDTTVNGRTYRVVKVQR